MRYNYTLCRPILSEYGIWDQIRVDQGKEWVLMLFIQEELSHLRRNTSCDPHLQSTSKQVRYMNGRYTNFDVIVA